MATNTAMMVLTIPASLVSLDTFPSRKLRRSFVPPLLRSPRLPGGGYGPVCYPSFAAPSASSVIVLATCLLRPAYHFDRPDVAGPFLRSFDTALIFGREGLTTRVDSRTA